MVFRASLIAFAAVLAGCQSTQQARLSGAAITQAIAKAPVPKINLPDACTAKTGRAYPKAGEPWVVLQKRWEFIADARDQQSADCAQWADDYNAAISQGAK